MVEKHTIEEWKTIWESVGKIKPPMKPKRTRRKVKVPIATPIVSDDDDIDIDDWNELDKEIGDDVVDRDAEVTTEKKKPAKTKKPKDEAVERDARTVAILKQMGYKIR